MNSKRSVRFSAVALALACATPLLAGVRRDDRNDLLDHIALGNDLRYKSVGAVSHGSGLFAVRGSGTLISPRWVLTAAHMVDSTATRTFNYGGTEYDNGTSVTAINWLTHPSWNRATFTDGWDIGLIQLPSAITTITPASRFTGNELGMIGTSVGFGLPGVGSSGQNLFSTSKAKRAGTNTLDALGGAFIPAVGNNIVGADFDDPGNADGKNVFGAPTPLHLEYCIAQRDSGGGTFVDVGGRAYLAAVHSFIHAFPTASGGDGNDNASYSDTFGSTRVTAFNEWIDDNIANHWANSSGGSFAAGANWSQGAAVPGAGDIASLNLPNNYAIDFSAPVMNDRLLARRGDVTLNLGGAAYTLTSPTYEGSLVVGKYSGNDARVTFTGGTVNTKDAVVAELSGSVGRITVGSGATWNCATDAYVGGAFVGAGGTGTVRVTGGGSLAVAGTMTLYAGGTLELAGGNASAGLLRLGGGTLAGAGTFASPVVNENGVANVTSGTLRLTGALTNSAGSTLTKTGGGTLVVAGPQSHGPGASVHVTAGSARFDTDGGSTASKTLSVNVDGGASAQFNVTQHLAALNLAPAASATLAAGGSRVLCTRSLAIGAGGVLNTGDNDLIVDYTGASVENAVRQFVRDGRLAFTAAAGDVALAIADNAEWGKTTFNGESIDTSTVVGKYTFFGDANLDGAVTGDDYLAVDSNLGTGNSWIEGDFNLSDTVTGDDYLAIDANLGKGTPTPLAWAALKHEMTARHAAMFGEEYLAKLAAVEATGFTIVPEPTALGLLTIGTIAAIRRRRRT